MLGFEEARTHLLALATAVHTEEIPLTEALGRVLSDALLANEDHPRIDNSAMDGYALCTADLNGEAPYHLPVAGESRAGLPLGELQPGHTCRIFTGAQVPRGADAVLLQENVQRISDVIQFTHRSYAGEHIRKRGHEMLAGSIAVPAGTRLGAFQLGLCAALDQTTLRVAKQPRVTVICTGDELRDAGVPGPVGSIPESNSIALAALLNQAGARARIAPRASDTPQATARAIAEALSDADVVLTVGGASVGDHDCVRGAVAELGATLEFWKVSVKPGKPLLVARIRDKLLIGLPGNPVSAQVTCLLFVLPLIRKLQGCVRHTAPFRPATLLARLQQKPGRTGFFRGNWQTEGVRPLLEDSSGAVASMSEADALIMADANLAEFPAGTLMPTLSLYEAVYL